MFEGIYPIFTNSGFSSKQPLFLTLLTCPVSSSHKTLEGSYQIHYGLSDLFEDRSNVPEFKMHLLGKLY